MRLRDFVTKRSLKKRNEELKSDIRHLKVADITDSGDDSILRGLIQRDLTEITIPNGVTSIGKYAFANYENLTSIALPDSVTSIDDYAFLSCKNLISVTIANGVTNIKFAAFRYCSSLTIITIPSSVTSIGSNALQSCSALEQVTLGDGFNCNKLDLSASALYSRETILQWLNALADRTGQTAYTLTIGATNLAKLTEEDILIATNKNWTLA